MKKHERSADEVAKLIQRLGYEPVWKDRDAALTAKTTHLASALVV